jgi:hypothetical protein
VSRAGWLCAVALALTVVGCGGSGGSSSDGGGADSPVGGSSAVGAHGCSNIQGSCTSNGGTDTMSCDEFAGYDATLIATFMSHCNGANQVYATKPCDRTGAVGGCAIAVNGTCSVEWGYAPSVSATDLQTACMGSGTFVTP